MTDLSILRRATIAILTGITLITVVGYLLLSEGLQKAQPAALGLCAVFFSIAVSVNLLTTVVPWYVTSGRISVSVDAEQLIVRRREAVLFACRCDEIVKVALRGGTTSWTSLYPQQSSAGGRFPRLRVWTRTGEWDSPGLLLWQGEAETFERTLLEALSKNR